MSGTYLRVGLLLVLSVALGIALVLFLGRNRVSNGVPYETYFTETVQGLDVGSPVKFRGVQLGQVTEIGLAAASYAEAAGMVRDAGNRLVVVRFVVDPGKFGQAPQTDDAVKAGLRVRLAAQGITGLAYLELDFVDPARFPAAPVPWTPKTAVIPSMPSTIAQFQDAAQALAAKLQEADIPGLVEALHGLVADARAQISGGSLQQTLAEAAALMKTLRAGAEAADIPAMATELRETVAALRNLAGGQQSRDLIAATTKTAERLSEAVSRLPTLITTLEAAVRRVNNGTADAQAELLPALRDARAAAASLRDTSETLRRYPSSILLGAPPPRTRQ
ncbi:MAG: MCE family protein [Acetobacteraceae bacterium]|nr:MCE family protein [Acetobacteraceae bacterium]